MLQSSVAMQHPFDAALAPGRKTFCGSGSDSCPLLCKKKQKIYTPPPNPAMPMVYGSLRFWLHKNVAKIKGYKSVQELEM
jgi:hypothetical protein